MKNDYFSRIKFRFLKKSAMIECFRKRVKIIFLEKVIYLVVFYLAVESFEFSSV